MPALPAAVLPFAERFFAIFPELLVTLGSPDLEKFYDLPPQAGTEVRIEDTGKHKLVQVRLKRRPIKKVDATANSSTNSWSGGTNGNAGGHIVGGFGSQTGGSTGPQTEPRVAMQQAQQLLQQQQQQDPRTARASPSQAAPLNPDQSAPPAPQAPSMSHSSYGSSVLPSAGTASTAAPVAAPEKTPAANNNTNNDINTTNNTNNNSSSAASNSTPAPVNGYAPAPAQVNNKVGMTGRKMPLPLAPTTVYGQAEPEESAAAAAATAAAAAAAGPEAASATTATTTTTTTTATTSSRRPISTSTATETPPTSFTKASYASPELPRSKSTIVKMSTPSFEREREREAASNNNININISINNSSSSSGMTASNSSSAARFAPFSRTSSAGQESEGQLQTQTNTAATTTNGTGITAGNTESMRSIPSLPPELPTRTQDVVNKSMAGNLGGSGGSSSRGGTSSGGVSCDLSHPHHHPHHHHHHQEGYFGGKMLLPGAVPVACMTTGSTDARSSFVSYGGDQPGFLRKTTSASWSDREGSRTGSWDDPEGERLTGSLAARGNPRFPIEGDPGSPKLSSPGSHDPWDSDGDRRGPKRTHSAGSYTPLRSGRLVAGSPVTPASPVPPASPQTPQVAPSPSGSCQGFLVNEGRLWGHTSEYPPSDTGTSDWAGNKSVNEEDGQPPPSTTTTTTQTGRIIVIAAGGGGGGGPGSTSSGGGGKPLPSSNGGASNSGGSALGRDKDHSFGDMFLTEDSERGSTSSSVYPTQATPLRHRRGLAVQISEDWRRGSNDTGNPSKAGDSVNPNVEPPAVFVDYATDPSAALRAQKGRVLPLPGAFSNARTLFVFDWDDTLCPTSWIRQTLKDHMSECLNWADEQAMDDWQYSIPAWFSQPLPEDPDVRQKIHLLQQEVISLIIAAQSLGVVCIVTNAVDGWVQKTTKKWLPQLKQYILGHGARPPVNIYYGQRLYRCPTPGTTAASLGWIDSQRDLTWWKTVAILRALGQIDDIYRLTPTTPNRSSGPLPPSPVLSVTSSPSATPALSPAIPQFTGPKPPGSSFFAEAMESHGVLPKAKWQSDFGFRRIENIISIGDSEAELQAAELATVMYNSHAVSEVVTSGHSAQVYNERHRGFGSSALPFNSTNSHASSTGFSSALLSPSAAKTGGCSGGVGSPTSSSTAAGGLGLGALGALGLPPTSPSSHGCCSSVAPPASVRGFSAPPPGVTERPGRPFIKKIKLRECPSVEDMIRQLQELRVALPNIANTRQHIRVAPDNLEALSGVNPAVRALERQLRTQTA